MQLTAFERLAQRLARAENLFLADEFIERRRTHSRGQRLRPVGDFPEQRRVVNGTSRRHRAALAAKYMPQPTTKLIGVPQPPRDCSSGTRFDAPT